MKAELVNDLEIRLEPESNLEQVILQRFQAVKLRHTASTFGQNYSLTLTRKGGDRDALE